MKTMTCIQLWGACDEQFHAETFDEIANISKNHCMNKLNEWDVAHLKAMEEMKKLMSKPEMMNNWFNFKKKEFEELIND